MLRVDSGDREVVRLDETLHRALHRSDVDPTLERKPIDRRKTLIEIAARPVRHDQQDETVDPGGFAEIHDPRHRLDTHSSAP
jgi:hypothetical protein